MNLDIPDFESKMNIMIVYNRLEPCMLMTVRLFIDRRSLIFATQ